MTDRFKRGDFVRCSDLTAVPKWGIVLDVNQNNWFSICTVLVNSTKIEFIEFLLDPVSGSYNVGTS